MGLKVDCGRFNRRIYKVEMYSGTNTGVGIVKNNAGVNYIKLGFGKSQKALMSQLRLCSILLAVARQLYHYSCRETVHQP